MVRQCAKASTCTAITKSVKPSSTSICSVLELLGPRPRPASISEGMLGVHQPHLAVMLLFRPFHIWFSVSLGVSWGSLGHKGASLAAVVAEIVTSPSLYCPMRRRHCSERAPRDKEHRYLFVELRECLRLVIEIPRRINICIIADLSGEHEILWQGTCFFFGHFRVEVNVPR